ncbi:MAG: aminotransferase class I/II-fold pyridoxal phosphate-dependent enzyme [Myxococcales bacterium]|nr:aminotransferase class I/II-fold pyridoxal phosphate-dependent enzyme [Myxococcales bacterium]
MSNRLPTLVAEHPAAARLLSPLGRRAEVPLGIPQQSAQAAGCLRQASIGQITTGDGDPLTVPAVSDHFAGLDRRVAFLYAPTAGLRPLREAWQARIDVPGCSLPVVTSGMSHGLSILADLFGCPDHPLVLADPFWDNYTTIWAMRTGSELRSFPFFNAARGFNLAGLAGRLDELTGPASLLLNFPNNPTGYTVTLGEAEALIERILAHPHPLAVICDDAYAGLYFDPDCYGRSLFGALAARADRTRLLVCKVDGATKELVFFGGRVGFLTFGVGGAAGEALVDKAAAILRGTISSVNAPAQAAVLAALSNPKLASQQEEVLGVLRQRYDALTRALAAEGLDALPFNSGCFALIQLRADQDAEQLRLRLIREQSTGVIAVPSVNALRVAFCSIDEADIPDLAARLAAVVLP